MPRHHQTMPAITGMEEIIALENIIRSKDPNHVIIRKAWSGPGKRLDALRRIANELKETRDEEREADLR